jgi:hypothetical protein
VRARTNAFLDRVSLTDIDVVSETNIEPYPGIAATEYSAFRTQMAHDLVELSALLEPEATSAGVPV